jgi:Tol biopolymer transport system component
VRSDCACRSPSWSPNGRRIAFIRLPPEVPDDEVWIMRADGSGQRFVARTSSVGEAEWSPDGSRIAFVAADDEIHLVDPASGTDTRVTHESGATLVGQLSWSPDGRWLAFSELAGCGPCDGASSLAKVRSDGTHQQSLEPRRRFHSGTGAPSWSPDGRFIAFCQSTFGQGRAERWTMHPDGSVRRRLATTGCVSDWRPLASR